MPELYEANKKEKSPVAVTEAFKEESVAGEAWWKGVINKVLRESGETPRRVLMGAYHVRPMEKFVTQQQDEEIVLLLREHPITNLKWFLMVLFMLTIPSLVSLIGMLDGVPMRFVFVGKMFWYLMTLMIAFENFLAWYYSIFIVTNERLVDIDFENLLTRKMTYANLNHIEEPTMVTRGFLRTMLQYGNVLVQTASEVPTMEALNCPYPHKVIDIITRLAEELEKRRERGE